MRASQLFTLSWNCKFFSFYRLHHPNIVELLEVHEDKTKVYLVMELWVNNNNNKQTNFIKKTNWVFVFFYNFRTKLKNGDDVLLPQLHRKCCLHFWHISVFCHALKFLFWNRFHQRATSKVHNDHVFLALKSHSHLSCQLFHRSTSKPLTEPNTRQNQESYLNLEITFETRWHFLVIFFYFGIFCKGWNSSPSCFSLHCKNICRFYFFLSQFIFWIGF